MSAPLPVNYIRLARFGADLMGLIGLGVESLEVGKSGSPRSYVLGPLSRDQLAVEISIRLSVRTSAGGEISLIPLTTRDEKFR